MILHTLPQPLLGLLLVLLCLAGCATPVVIQPEPETTPAETAFQRGTCRADQGDIRPGHRGFYRGFEAHAKPRRSLS